MRDDDHNDLAALDFSGADGGEQSGVDDYSDADSAALDFSGPQDDGREESAFDALSAYAPAEPEDTPTELEAIHTQTGDEDEQDSEDALAAQLFTVTNPSGTVSVSALMDGRIHQVELSAKATSMTESELAEEILVIADLARQKGLSGQHTFLSETMHALGAGDDQAVRELLENGLNLSSPEQADLAQAEVFATRYAADHG